MPIKEQLLKISKLSKELFKYNELNKNYSKSFWKEKLLNIELLDLSFLKPSINHHKSLSYLQPDFGVSIQELTGLGEIRFSFDNETLMMVNRLKKKHMITPYLYGQIIYAVLINRYTGQNKFCINYPVAIKEGRDLIYGAHVNTTIIPYDFGKINVKIVLIIASGKLCSPFLYACNKQRHASLDCKKDL